VGLFGPPDIAKLEAKGDVPGLIKALGHEKDSRVRQAAVAALRQIGDVRAVGALCDLLNDAEFRVKVAAAEALGTIGDLRAVEPLIKALDGGFNKPQSAAAGALAQIGDPRALEPLISALEDSHNDQKVREAAATALRAMGPLPVDALKHGEWSVRERAAKALDGLGWRPNDLEETAWYWAAKGDWAKCVAIGIPALEPLITALQDRTHAFPGAVEALGSIGDSRAIEPLVAALKGGVGDEPAAAANALVRIGGPRPVELLLPVLRERPSERKAAAEALDRLGWRPDEGEQGAWYWAARQDWARCVAIGPPAVDALCHALRGYSGYEPGAAEALGQIGDARAIEPLIAALTKLKPWMILTDEVVCGVVVEALGRIGAAAVEPLIAILPNSAAISALGQIGDVRAVPPLLAALGGEDATDREASARALGLVGDPVAIEPLNAALKDQFQKVREAAAQALARLQRPIDS
jgi:HEAT repeat protein